MNAIAKLRLNAVLLRPLAILPCRASAVTMSALRKSVRLQRTHDQRIDHRPISEPFEKAKLRKCVK